MSIGKMPVPVASSCIGLDWLRATGPCPDTLAIYGDNSLAVNFAGRGKVGDACGGSDAYVALGVGFPSSFNDIYIDVWRAHRDSIWSSSVTIDLYLGHTSVGSLRVLQAYPRNYGAISVSKYPITTDGTLCGTSVKATVTVNSDGTFSIA